jgi:hypothetical protein
MRQMLYRFLTYNINPGARLGVLDVAKLAAARRGLRPRALSARVLSVVGQDFSPAHEG